VSLRAPILSTIALLTAISCTPTPEQNRVARKVTSPQGDTGVVVAGSNGFTWDMYGALVADAGDDNVFFSPFSMTSALGMTLAGAEGQTQTEMSDVLGVSGDEAAWHTALGALTRDLSGDLDRGYTLHIANKLFGQQEYPWNEDFLAVCSDDYGAPFEPVDFVSDPEAERVAVNEWVADQTEDRIEDLLPIGSVTVDTRLVLANAIYFLADWETQFDPEDTRDGAFHKLDGSTVTAPLMSLDTEGVEEHHIETAWTDDAAIVRLPYKDDEVSMILVVPHALDGLPDLEAGLDAARFDQWVADLEPAGDVLVTMPKFEFEWEADLVPVLEDLGMPSAFDRETADFTGMADTPPEEGRLRITGVFHKAFVKVDEVGTEAAAATGVVVGTDSAPEPIYADHPFLFAIRDDLTGAILFVGRVTDPS